MQKNLIIFILMIISVISTSYGLYQKARADKNELRALESKILVREMELRAEEQRALAEQQRQLAEINAMEAMRQREIAQQALQKGKAPSQK